MAKEVPPTKLEIVIMNLAEAVSNQTRETAKTNELIKKLIGTNEAFLGTLTSFLDQDHRLKVDEALRKLEQAKSLTPTPHDMVY